MFGYAQKENRRIENSMGGPVSVHALRDISLDLRQGDRVGLIGRNGSGKTTLLRVLSGVYEPTKGRITSFGRVSSLTDIMLGMDMDATGYENIIMRGIVLGMRKKDAYSLIPNIEEFTELGSYLNLPVRTYSQGMLLRLAFSVSTSIAPDILLMDEMIGAGDSQFVSKAQKRINDLIGGVSILVIASHNDSILRQFCNKALVLNEGNIAYFGNVDECLNHYHRIDA